MPGESSAVADRRLLSLAGEGDGAAFDELMRREQASIFQYVRTFGLSTADAEDALQETFLAAWRGARGFRGDGTARNWLVSIARNVVRHQRRRRVGAPSEFSDLDAIPESESLESLALSAGWGADDGTPMFRGEDARELLDAALAMLSPEERETLLLRDGEGFTGEEAARTLGIGLAAMKSRLHRARLHLAAVLKERLDAHP